MTVREHEIQARQFEYDEMRRKLRDLNELRQHIESSLDRIASGRIGGDRAGDERRSTLRNSLDEIGQRVLDAETAMEAARSFLRESEHVRDGYDRVPVAVGKGRGRGQVEHIRIVRAQR